MEYVIIISIHADPAMPPGYEEWGGTNVYMKELIDGFTVRKIKCVMFTRKSMALQDVEKYSEYCTVIRLHNGEAVPIDKNLLWQYHSENLAKIQTFIDNNGKPKIIHSVYWNSGRLAIELGDRNNIPFVHSVISNSKGRVIRGAVECIPKREEYEREIYRKAKWVICVSKDERNDIIELYGISGEKVIVAGQHINETFLSPARDKNGFPLLQSKINNEAREEISDKHNTAYSIQTEEQYWNHKVFTYMGRVGYNKGLEQIFKAWYRLYCDFGKECPPLWVAGGSVSEIHTIRELLKKDITELNTLEENRLIVWWGYLDAAGLSTILLKTLALIMHSYYEPGGRVIVEAMAEGVPVVATPYGFGNDYIVDWRNGFLLEYGDIDRLYLRLAHFVHQPFLADALGRNARIDAKMIISTWDFFDSHMMAYGFQSCKKINIMGEKQNVDNFKTRKINLFPYSNLPLSNAYLTEFVSRLIKDDVVHCAADKSVAATSDIYRIKTQDGNVVVKHVFTRLRLGPMLNPLDRNCYVKKAGKSFHVELNVYKRVESASFLGYDDTHYLFAFKELNPLPYIDICTLRQCVDFLTCKPDIATNDEKSIFQRIVRRNLRNTDELMEMYCCIEQELPNYYFERSGCFSEIIGWVSMPFILDFNRNNFTNNLFQELHDICTFFSNYAQYDNIENLRGINSDVKLKHFLLNSDQLEMIDFEKYAIGCVESEIAQLFVDYWRTVDKDCSISDMLCLLPRGINKNKVLSSMAHICLFDIQVVTVVQTENPEFLIDRLRMIHQVANCVFHQH